MKKKLWISGAIALLTLTLGISALASAPGFHGRFGRRGWMGHRMARELNLTQDQQTQIKGILQAEKPRIQPLMQQLRQNRQEEMANVTGTFDETQARAFADKQAKVMSDLIVERERVKSQIYAVLTPEQRQKAAQLVQQRHERMQQRMQKHMQKNQQGVTTQQKPG